MRKRRRYAEDLRERARDLRRRGLVFRQIADELGAPRSTVAQWCRGMQLPLDAAAELGDRRRAGNKLRAEEVSESWRRRREVARADAAASMPAFDDHALFFTGLALYWGEGSKDKPWRRASRVCLTNSDADVVRVFLAWLRLLDVTDERLSFRVAIHESADVTAAEAYWREVVGATAEFLPTTLKRHNPATVRHNNGDSYHGCLVVRVRQAWALYQQIEGWLSAVRTAVACSSPSGMV